MGWIKTHEDEFREVWECDTCNNPEHTLVKQKSKRYYYDSNDIYEYISQYQELEDDLIIDDMCKKRTKQQIIDEIEMFQRQKEVKDIYNMYYSKKISTLSEGRKRGIAFSYHWFKRWEECVSSPYCDPLYKGPDEDAEYETWRDNNEL